MRLGKAINANALFPTLPRLETLATYYDGPRNKSSVGCLLVAPRKLTPSDVPIEEIRRALPKTWSAFIDSVKTGIDYLYFCVIHRSDIPRLDIQGKFRL